MSAKCTEHARHNPACPVTEELKGIKRVLTLVDGYLSTQPQDLALAWDGGIMTYGELRNHLNAALKTKVLNGPPNTRTDAPTGRVE